MSPDCCLLVLSLGKSGMVEKSLGVVDSISVGFKLVQRHIWLILLPALVDLWLWLGPHLSISDTVNSLLAAWPTAGLPSDVSELVTASQQMLQTASQQLNLLWLLSNSLTWFNVLMPGLVEPARFTTAGAAVQVQPGLILLGAPLLLAVGLGLGSVFLTSVVSRLQAETAPAGSWLGHAFRLWIRVLLYGLVMAVLLMGFALASSLFLSMVLVLVPALATPLASLGVLLGGWIVVWIYLLLYFAVAAMAWDGVAPGQAMWRSANVVGRNFWSTLGLVMLTVVIMGGFQFIWQRLAQFSPWLVLVSIIGNAFLLTGLTTARLVFYKDRYARWQQALAT